MSRSRALLAAHLILALLGVVLVAVGSSLSGTGRDACIAVGTALIATPVVSGLLRYFAGDPLGDVRAGLDELAERLGTFSSVLESSERTGLREVHSNRGEVEARFLGFAESARERVWLLAYAMEFLVDSPAFREALRRKAQDRCDTRVLLADPQGLHVASRHEERDQEVSLAHRVRESIRIIEAELPNVSLRLYDAPLYASVYIFDRTVLFCPALYGSRGADAPAFLAEDGALLRSYERHFEALWNGAESRARLSA